MIFFLIVGATLFTSVFLRLGGGGPIQGFILELASGAQGILLTVFIMVLVYAFPQLSLWLPNLLGM